MRACGTFRQLVLGRNNGNELFGPTMARAHTNILFPSDENAKLLDDLARQRESHLLFEKNALENARLIER